MNNNRDDTVAPSLTRLQHIHAVWAYIVPEGVDWRKCFTREFWLRNFEKLMPGDRVEIRTFDFRIAFTMHIINVNSASNPVYFNVVFTPIYPLDLELPVMERQRPPRYEARLAPGHSVGQFALYNVVDVRTGERVRDNSMSRNAALDLASALNNAADQSEAEMLADNFVDLARAVGKLPTPTPAKRGRGRPRKATNSRNSEPAPALVAQTGE